MPDKKLSPGERAINWAKAAAIIVPLFGAGVFAGNSETVHNWLAPDDVLPTEATQDQRNAAINAKFAEIDETLERLEAELESADDTNRTRLQSQINANKQAISKWHD